MKRNHGDLNELVTKGYLDLRLAYIEHKIDSYHADFEDFQREMREFKESISKSIDWLVGALKKFDKEHTVLTNNYTEIHSTIDDHESRIIKCEEKLNS